MTSLPTVLALENASMIAWPALEEVRDGAWVARFANGFSRRANSLQSLDASDDDNVEARLEAMRALFAKQGIAFQFRSTPLTGPALISTLAAQGWTETDRNHVMAMPLRPVMRAVPAHTKLFEPTDTAWVQTQTGFAKTQSQATALAGILARLTVPAKAFVAYRDDLKPVAAALVVIADGIAFFLNVVVDEDFRGMGYGRAIMSAGLNWASQHKAPFAALQVQADNAVAMPLYASLGFEPVYQYLYHVAPQ